MLNPLKQFLRRASCSFTTLLLVLVFSFVLSGCGGGGGGSTGMDTGMMPGTGGGTGGGEMPMEPPTPMPYVVDGLVANPSPSVFANSDADTLGSLQPQGQEFGPLTVAVKELADGSGLSALEEGTAYLKSISSDGANGFRMTYFIEGEESSFHLMDEDYVTTSFRKDRDDGVRARLWSPLGSFNRDTRDGGNSTYEYFDTIGWLYDPPEKRWFRGYSAYGVRTAPENLPTMGTAEYEGIIRIETWNADAVSSGTSRTRIVGVLTLEANFDDGEISGSGNRLTVQKPGASNSERMGTGNVVNISGGDIEGSRFTADWAGEDTDTNSAYEDSVRELSGRMLGEFYGPAAEEVGGVLNGSRAAFDGTPDQHVIGLFGAKEALVTAVGESTEPFDPDHAAALVQEFSGANIGNRTPDIGEAYLKSIMKDGAGGLSVTYVINGVESNVHFGPNDYSSSTSRFREIGGNEYFFWKFGTELNYADVTGWAHDMNDSAGDAIKRYRGHNVHGVTTENMPTTGSATYEGLLFADTWDVNNPRNGGRSRVRGDLTLEANFGNGEVSGRIDGLRIRSPGESQYRALGSGNSIGISNGAIAGSGFTAADWTGMDTDANSADKDSVRRFSGTMSGGFYGPAAEEVAGVMNGRRDADTMANAPEQLFVGSFGAKKTGQ